MSDNEHMRYGTEMYNLAARLFPICRSITGDGVRETLGVLRKILPQITIREVPTGTLVFDWTVPKEWTIRDAFIEDLDGNRIISFSDSNLHVMGYSAPVDKIVTREELLGMIYTQPDQPDVIPYVTSYYKERSGFCLSENQKNTLDKDRYHIVIDSELKDGSLTYAELLISGESEEEIFLSTYVCHPSMANNELSGLCVVTYLAKWLLECPRRYSYRIVFVPETIGSLTYMSKNLDEMKRRIIAGFNVSCVGDNRTYSYIASRYGNTLADKALKNILSFHYPEYTAYSFLQRGSDERQYCAPGIDLPLCGFCRTKYGEYPEYHTSADNLSLISPEGLAGALDILKKCIHALEHNYSYNITCLGEPQLGKYGLYPTISQKGAGAKDLIDFIAYADGRNDIFDISNITSIPVEQLISMAENLTKYGLLQPVDADNHSGSV